MRTVVIGLLCGIGLAACGSDGVEPPPSGELQYRASSAQGVPLVAGNLILVSHEDSTVTGSWAIAWVAGADTTAPVGPQLGSGTLSGRRYADGSLQLNLNPFYADNNVFLSATVTAAGLEGVWSWSGFAGPIANGRFQAAF